MYYIYIVQKANTNVVCKYNGIKNVYFWL